MTRKVIKDSKQLAHPHLKLLFDGLFLIGAALLVIKLCIIALNKFTAAEINLYGGLVFWNFGSLILMIGAGIGSGIVKEKYKAD